ncbi:MAG: ABC transporter permease [Halieaceae bacterium]
MLYRLQMSVVKEILSLLRDPASRRLLIGAPILQTLVFSTAATLEVSNADVALLNQDAGRWSYEYVARVIGARFVDEIVIVQSMEEMTELIDRRQVLIGLHLQADFSRDVEAGRPASVQVILDGRRANAAQVASGYLAEISATLGVELEQRDGVSARGSPGVELRHWFNPNLHFRWFIVTSLSALLTMMLTLVTTSLSIAQERELGTFDQVLVSPLNSAEIIISKTVPGLMVGVFVGLLIVLIAVYGFGVPLTSNPLLLFASLLLFLFSVVGLGLAISAFCQTQQQAILGVFIGTIPMILISGFMTPVENMPVWLQVAAELSPLKHMLIIIQGCFLKSWGVAEIWPHAWPMLLIALVTLSFATVVVKSRLE